MQARRLQQCLEPRIEGVSVDAVRRKVAPGVVVDQPQDLQGGSIGGVGLHVAAIVVDIATARSSHW